MPLQCLVQGFLLFEVFRCAGRELIPDKMDAPEDGGLWFLLAATGDV